MESHGTEPTDGQTSRRQNPKTDGYTKALPRLRSHVVATGVRYHAQPGRCKSTCQGDAQEIGCLFRVTGAPQKPRICMDRLTAMSTGTHRLPNSAYHRSCILSQLLRRQLILLMYTTSCQHWCNAQALGCKSIHSCNQVEPHALVHQYSMMYPMFSHCQTSI